MSDFRIEKWKLTDLVSDINIGAIQLPQFQRDYKWKPVNVMKLIDSINKLHPAGTLLFLEIDTNKIPFIAYEKVRSVQNLQNDVKPNYLILDGQQRLTSIHSALTNSGSKSYFFDLIQLKKIYQSTNDSLDLIDDKILVAKNLVKGAEQLLHSKYLLPFSMLLNIKDCSKSKEDLRSKLFSFKERLRLGTQEDAELYEFIETKLYNFLDSFYDYQFPTVILPKNLDISGVCKVFQSINTTGLKLSAFDICVATYMPSGVNIKEKLKHAKEDKPNIKSILSDDETIILQTIALMNGVSPKKNTLPDNLEAVHILSDWDNAVEYLDTTVGILEQIGLGLAKGTDLLPYQPIIPVLASSLAKSGYCKLNQGQKSSINTKIKKWLFTVCLDLRYTEGTDNKMKEDYKELVEWFLQESIPKTVTNGVNWNTNKVIHANKNGAFGKAILAIINLKQPRDFYTDESVGLGNQVASVCQQHHIFPYARYEKNNLSLINSVFNFTFITAKSNNYIKDKRTREYISGILEETSISEVALREKLSKHFINDECYNLLLSEDFEKFINRRSEEIFNYLKDIIGVNVRKAEVTDEQEVDIDSNFEDIIVEE